MIASLVQWFRDSKFGMFMLVVVIGAIALIVAAQGCNLQTMIKVDVPNGPRKALGLGSKITLRDFDSTFEEWTTYCERETQRFADNGEDAIWLFNFLGSAINTGLSSVDAAAGTSLPLGLIGISSLTGLAGLFMKQPGTSREIQKEKESSFNAGLRKAASIANGNGGTS